MRSLALYRLISRRKQRQQHRSRSLSRRIRVTTFGISIAFSLVLLVGLLVAGVFYAELTADLPSLEQLPVLLNPNDGLLLQPTRLYDRSGKNLLLSLENPGIPRRFLPLNSDKTEHLSADLARATVALLEPDFWQSPGFAWSNLASPEPQTLAERLVNNLLLWQEPPGLKHIVHLRLLGSQLVARYGRAQTLEWYLNSLYYGHMAVGADCAARLYLGKPASQLTLADAALLIAVSQTPALNPLDSPTAARERQQEVLAQLLKLGIIPQNEYDQAMQTPLPSLPTVEASPQIAPAFTRLVLDQLTRRIDQQRLELGGLRVITTLDSDLQQQLACAARSQLLRLEGQTLEKALSDSSSCEAARLLPTLSFDNKQLPSELMASALVYDLQSDEVLALLGKTSVVEENSDLNGYQPGSLLTPFVAVAGFTRGFSPSSLVWDIPASLPGNVKGVMNPDGSFHGPQRLRVALANDYLAPFAQMMAQIGPSNVWRLVEPLGLPRLEQDTDPTKVLFSGGNISLSDIALAYSAFANEGTQSGLRLEQGQGLQPSVVLKVEGINGLNWSGDTQLETQSVLSPQIAYLIHNMLSDDVSRRPTLGFPNPLVIGRPSGAKVGQTADGQQVWTVGYTPQRMVVTWLGLPEGNSLNQRLNVKMAAGLWHAVMQYTSRDLPAVDWSQPAGISTVNVCDPSGQLPTRTCPNIVSEVFLAGTEPNLPDTLYRTFQVNRETGLLATVFTPLEYVEERTYMAIPPEAQDWAQSAGLALPPTSYDVIQAPQILPDAHFDSPVLFSYVHGSVQITGTAAGDGFKAYQIQVGEGLDPVNWLQIGDESKTPVKNGVLGVWDTTKQPEGLYALRMVVQYQNQQINTVIIQVTVDNTPPQVSITYPQSGEEIQIGSRQEITLLAQVGDSVGIQLVTWLVDGVPQCEKAEMPFVCSWKPSVGIHNLVVVATDLAGNESRTDPVSFVVK